jgi:hypothetical protein
LLAQAGVGVWGQKPKTELLRLSFGCANENSSGSGWEEVAGWCIQGSGGGGALRSLVQAGVGVWGQKPKTKLLQLGFGCANGNSGGDQWREVVGWCVQGSSGHEVARSQMHGGGGWLGAESPYLSRCGSVLGVPCQTAVEGGGRMWLGGSYNATVVVGCCIRKPKAGRGLGAENPKPNVTARFQAAFGLNAILGGAVKLQHPLQ